MFDEIEEVGKAMSCSLTLCDNTFDMDFVLTLVSLNPLSTSVSFAVTLFSMTA